MDCAMFLIFTHVFLYYNITYIEKYISNIYTYTDFYSDDLPKDL